jgi:hypothetical protein
VFFQYIIQNSGPGQAAACRNSPLDPNPRQYNLLIIRTPVKGQTFNWIRYKPQLVILLFRQVGRKKTFLEGEKLKKYRFVLMVLVLLAAACGNAKPSPVIDMNPKDLLFPPASLPAGGNYGNGVQQAYPNSMFKNDYVSKSGRVYAFGVTYTRGTTFKSPQSVVDEVILYKNTGGAQYSLRTYFPSLCVAPEYAIVNDFFIGEGTVVCTQVSKNTPESSNIYWIYFVYKNVGHLITGSGMTGEVTPEFMHGLAQSAFQILQKAPISTTVTFKP